MAKIQKKHGFTFFITIGSFGGFYMKTYKTGTMRMCLGWIAFTICFYDAETEFTRIIEKSKNINH